MFFGSKTALKSLSRAGLASRARAHKGLKRAKRSKKKAHTQTQKEILGRIIERGFAPLAFGDSPREGISPVESNFPASHISHNVSKPENPAKKGNTTSRQVGRFLVIFRNSSSPVSRFMLSTRSSTTCSPKALRLMFSAASTERDPRNTPSSHQPGRTPKTPRTYIAPCPCNQARRPSPVPSWIVLPLASNYTIPQTELFNLRGGQSPRFPLSHLPPASLTCFCRSFSS